MNRPLTLTDEQLRALERNDPHEAVPVVAPDSTAKYLLVRIDAFPELQLDTGEFDPEEAYPLYEEVLAKEDRDDPLLATYQEAALPPSPR
jgi:hypothetical protein